MPRKRHGQTVGVIERSIAVRSLGLRLAADQRIEPHRHEWAQLVYATEGVMRIDTPTGCWVVPPEHAVWIPAGFEHSIRMTGVVRMRTVYLRPGLLEGLPATCGVIHVTALLRELVLVTLQIGMLADTVPEQARLAAVLADQIRNTREVPLQVRLPVDARALAVARKAQVDLSRPIPMAQLVRGSGASVRTIERLFVQETGLSFGCWQQRVRALHAIERLAAGDSVANAGLAVGYESTSAFIAMFKRVLGRTPGNYSMETTDDPES